MPDQGWRSANKGCDGCDVNATSPTDTHNKGGPKPAKEGSLNEMYVSVAHAVPLRGHRIARHVVFDPAGQMQPTGLT